MSDKNTNDAQKAKSSRDQKIATLSSIRDDSDPGGQAFYAGGSENSGQQVLGPQKSKNDSDNIISDMFKHALQHAISEDQLANKPVNKPFFVGQGSTLGSNTESSKKVFMKPISDESNNHTTLKLWKDGFCVDDGPLRLYQDPENAEFLAAVRSGDVPRELARPGRAEVHIKMEDHRSEMYKPIVKPTTAFSGEGQRLGAPTMEFISNMTESKEEYSSEQALEKANKFLQFDNNQPHTRIQIRLSDGSSLVSQINIDRTISDLRQYICLARPEYGARQFQLMTTFPNKIIDDESQTIKESGLSNSTLVQRIIE